MPVIDGVALLKDHIRPKYPDLPVVFFTGLGYDEETMRHCRLAGGNGYVSKGLAPSDIYSALIRVLQLQRPAD